MHVLTVVIFFFFFKFSFLTLCCYSTMLTGAGSYLLGEKNDVFPNMEYDSIFQPVI